MATGTLVDVVMPQMGVSVSEGTITRWMKGVGDTIEADETIVEISTDKVDTEIPSPASGVIKELLADEGDTVPVNTRIAVIDTGGAGCGGGGGDTEPAQAQAAQAEAPPTADAPPEAPATASPAPPAPEPAQTPAPAAEAGDQDGDDSGRTFVSP